MTLWVRLSSFSPRDTPSLLAAVNLGDDADTTGAVCGQFVGVFWGGAEAFPAAFQV